ASNLKALQSIPADVQAKLDANLELMEQLGLSATPAIFYQDEQQQLQSQQGAPRPEMLGKILGKR
ncbi:MAG: thiol:disulfide interchange protein DsbG, partial [Pseudomonas sp.]